MPDVIDADARHDPASDPAYCRARDKALAVLASGDYEWQVARTMPDDVMSTMLVYLYARSPNTTEWHRHTLTDDSCGCPAYPRWCWHRSFLGLCGGVSHVLHRLQSEKHRGTCRICGADVPGRLICDTCWDIERARDFGGALPARKRGRT